MADKKKPAPNTQKPAPKKAPIKKDELSTEDLDKVAGGARRLAILLEKKK